MTKEEIIALIEINSGEKGDNATELANRGYNSALTSLGKIDIVPWNKFQDTFTLTAGTDIYLLGSDILSDHDEIKGLTQLWRTDQEDSEIQILNTKRFNAYKRGNNEAGQPYCVTIYKNADGDKVLEFFHNPDDAYVLWAEIRKSLTPDMIDDDFMDMIVWKAVIDISDPASGYYRKARTQLNRLFGNLRKESFVKWTGGQIQPGYRFGTQDGGLTVDSGRLFNFGR